MSGASWSQYVDELGLTVAEARIFAALAGGETLNREECLAALGKRFASDALVAMHILRIRKKIEGTEYSITSQRGRHGYTLVRKNEEAA